MGQKLQKAGGLATSTISHGRGGMDRLEEQRFSNRTGGQEGYLSSSGEAC